MINLMPALAKLFTQKVEQVRVSDLQLAVRQPLDDDLLWSYHNAGVFKYNYAMIYDFNPKASPPDVVVPREESDLQRRASVIKASRRRAGKPTAVDELGAKLCLIGFQRAAALNGIDLAKYAHLDNGRRQMTVNNILRARHRKGEEVHLGSAALDIVGNHIDVLEGTY